MVGICHLKIKTIANTLEISERTVRRHIKYLKENGFITVIPTSRPKKGGDGANAYAINSPLVREEMKKIIMSVRKCQTAEMLKRLQRQCLIEYLFKEKLLFL